MALEALKPLDPNARDIANSKVPKANTPEQRKAWITAYKNAGGSTKVVQPQAKSTGTSSKNKQSLKNSKTPAKSQPNIKPKSATQTCSAQGCAITSLTVKCGHSGRGFILDPKGGKPTKDNKHVIQVISANRPNDAEVMEIKFSGSCQKGNPSSSSESTNFENDTRPNTSKACPSVQFKGQSVNVHQPSPLKARVYAQDGSSIKYDFIDFFKYVFNPQSIKPYKYTITSKGCCPSQPINATIESFPATKWDANLSMGYRYGSHKDSNFNQNRGYTKLKKEGEFFFNGGLEVNYGNEKWSLGANPTVKGDHKSKYALTEGFYDGAQKMVNHLASFIGKCDSKYGSVKPEWPQIKFTGGVELTEHSSQFLVYPKGNFTFNFDPLIGATGTANILRLLELLAKGTPFGSFLTLVINLASSSQKGDNQKGIALEIKAELVCTGKVSGFAKFTYAENGKVNPEGSIGASLNFELYGQGDLKVKFFFIEAAAGGKIGAKSGVGGEIKASRFGNDPGLQGALLFNGLTVYYSYYMQVGRNSVKPTSRARRKKIATSDDNKLKTENMEEYVILGPGKWPEEDDAQVKLQNGTP